MSRNIRGVLLVVLLATLAQGVWAQRSYKSLHVFTGKADGGAPFASLIFDQAGNLYGTTASGGSGLHPYGTAFRLTPNSDGSWTESVLYNFCSVANCADGSSPFAALTFDQAGNLYGTTSGGGSCNYNGLGCGVVFELTPRPDGSWTESVLYSFCSLRHCADGWFPIAPLIFDQEGNLYDVTFLGGKVSGSCGADGCGTVFKLTPQAGGTWAESVLYRFSCSATNCSDGWGSGAGIVFDTAGNLYGTTTKGGTICKCGVVFELMPNSRGRWTEKVLHRFTGQDGLLPAASLIFDHAGNLYGTTELGGGHCNCGVAFRLTPNTDGSWTETVLHRFDSAKGALPVAPLTFDQAGNLYGTTLYGGNMSCDPSAGCGVVFKLTPNAEGAWIEKVVHSFAAHPGLQPYAGVVFDAAGNLYGTTKGNGYPDGSVYEIAP